MENFPKLVCLYGIFTLHGTSGHSATGPTALRGFRTTARVNFYHQIYTSLTPQWNGRESNLRHRDGKRPPNQPPNRQGFPKLEVMPTLCRSATLPAETNISEWRGHSNYKAASSGAHRRDISFRGFKGNSIPPPQPPSNFQDTPAFWNHQLPLYGNKCLEWHNKAPEKVFINTN